MCMLAANSALVKLNKINFAVEKYNHSSTAPGKKIENNMEGMAKLIGTETNKN